jgi:cytochrome P450
MDAELDIFSSDARRDPYPCYRRLRERAPVYWDPTISSFLLTRYDDCAAALRDPRLSAARAATGAESLPEPDRTTVLPFARSIRLWMLFRDPPDHTRLRSLVNCAFSPRMVARMRERIAALVHELLAAVPSGELDLMRDFAQPLPALVIADMLGAPRDERHDFVRWSDDLAAYIGGGPAALASRAPAVVSWRALSTRLALLAEARRAHPQDDLMSALVSVAERGDRLDADDLVATCVLLFFAGHETTRDLLGNGLLALLTHSAQLARLQAEPQRIALAIEELLRFDSPAQVAARIATEALEIRGVPVAKGQRVVAVLGAANRDPEQFAEPERLDVARAEVKHLSFAHGIHYCVGAPLARLEGELALRALIARGPRLLAAPESLSWRDSLGFRGLLALPIALTQPSRGDLTVGD